MNILIPDSWLREFLETAATPKQIKEYLSLCGPSIERINEVSGETIYDVEVTTNRPDSMSVFGVAREAAAILPRFEIAAKLANDPYHKSLDARRYTLDASLKLNIQTDPILNPRWVSVVIDNVTVKPSPDWLQKKIELTGIRSLNNIVDITNYFLRAYGQPVHAFDFAEIKPNAEGIPTMILRASQKGEKLTTLDGKTHSLPGGDIVIEDGAGRLIDLCGIRGAENSSIKSITKTIVLFMQTYDPVRIRKTSMALALRTEAATLFEKGLDEELVLPTMLDGMEMVKKLAGGEAASQIYDIYPKPYAPYQVSVDRKKVDAYIGKKLSNQEIKEILTPLGLEVAFNKAVIPAQAGIRNKKADPHFREDDNMVVTVPSFRRDIKIDVDIIEEIARLYGYHNVTPTLPDTPPPFSEPNKSLQWEEDIKIRLRDWGFTETYTYSMISEELMDIFGLDKSKAFKISNPLSSEWVYMRPSLWPSILNCVKQNLNLHPCFKIFELSMRYVFNPDDLPYENPTILICWTGERFLEAKGVAESILDLFGISTNDVILNSFQDPRKIPDQVRNDVLKNWYDDRHLSFGDFGSLGLVNSQLLTKLEIKTPITVLELEFAQLVKSAQTTKKYQPIPKYPPVIEDMTFVLPAKTPLGEIIAAIKNQSPLVYEVQLITEYQDTATFRIHYLNPDKQITDSEVIALRTQLKEMVDKTFNAKLRG
ncbi:hypothetical protein A2699_00145 [Candidatus Gottesmanbacteria bacterium RIFCSPHIGHO2_01_FULL_43_15]|nr:MAG: hypothetical protein A2699_00145 [Candidatus Gottesmanbacteria bacterium RIFCSPHIGHO2_01_FULL_43_15]